MKSWIADHVLLLRAVAFLSCYLPSSHSCARSRWLTVAGQAEWASCQRTLPTARLCEPTRPQASHNARLGSVQEALANLRGTPEEVPLSDLLKFVGIVVETWHSVMSDICGHAATPPVATRLPRRCFQACLKKQADPNPVSSLGHVTDVIGAEHAQWTPHCRPPD